jgi:Flp pilus assembly protein TadG
MPGPSKTCAAGTIRRFLRDRRGGAAVELALLAPILLTIPIGLWNAGEVLIEKTDLQRAAAAGAQYGSQSQFTAEDDAAAIRAVVRNSYSGDDAGLTIAAQTVVLCADGSNLADLTPGSCDTREYLRVRVSSTVRLSMDFGLFPESMALTEEVVMRHMF